MTWPTEQAGEDAARALVRAMTTADGAGHVLGYGTMADAVLVALAPHVAALVRAERAAALREAADRWDRLQTKENDHYSRRDPALWLIHEADAEERA